MPLAALDDIVELMHRYAGLLRVTGIHPALRRIRSCIDPGAVAKDSLLRLCATLARIEPEARLAAS